MERKKLQVLQESVSKPVPYQVVIRGNTTVRANGDTVLSLNQTLHDFHLLAHLGLRTIF